MRVFISWSREPSRAIARALGEWLGGLVQAAEPWVSDEEIGSGQRWRDEIATVLDETDFGIICLTRASQHNPWLMFEAGALAKHLSSARVIPLYIDLDPAEVTGPLADVQGRSLDQQGMSRVVHDINEATPKPVPKESLRRLFDRMWPDFEAEIAAAKTSVLEPTEPRRTTEDMLEEIVERVRRLERPQSLQQDLAQWLSGTLPPAPRLGDKTLTADDYVKIGAKWLATQDLAKVLSASTVQPYSAEQRVLYEKRYKRRASGQPDGTDGESE